MKNFQISLFEISGRFTRTRFAFQCFGTLIVGFLIIWLLSLATVQLGAQVGAIPALLIFAVFVMMFVSLLTALIRRLHDMGHKGWILSFPFIYIFLILFFFFGILYPELVNSKNQGLMHLAFVGNLGFIFSAAIPLQLFCCWLLMWPGVEGGNLFGKDPRRREEKYTSQSQIFLEEFFSFKGRIDRSFFIRVILCLVLVMNLWQGNLELIKWIFLFDNISAIFSIIFVQSPIGSLLVILITVIILLALLVSVCSVVVRRLHDLNVSGWYGISILIVLATQWIPGISEYFFFVWWIYIFALAWRRGNSEENLFGEKVLRTFPSRMDDDVEGEKSDNDGFL